MTRWLTEDELASWFPLAGVMLKLNPALDSQLQRDSDMTHFDYLCLAMLSEALATSLVESSPSPSVSIALNSRFGGGPNGGGGGPSGSSSGRGGRPGSRPPWSWPRPLGGSWPMASIASHERAAATSNRLDFGVRIGRHHASLAVVSSSPARLGDCVRKEEWPMGPSALALEAVPHGC